MRICFLTGTLGGGGAERVTAVIAGALAQRGHEVYLYVFSKSSREYVPGDRTVLNYMCSSFEAYQKLSVFQRIANIRSYLKQIMPDAAAGFMEAGYALYAASFGLRIKRIASLRITPESPQTLDWCRQWLTHRWFQKADAVVLQCQAQRKYPITRKWKHVTVIGNPVSEKALSSCVQTYRNSCRELVMAGRLETQKNYPMAIQAAAILCRRGMQVNLHIYGTGQEEGRLRQLAARKGVSGHVIFHGWAADIFEEYQKYDLFLLTSDYEGLPNSLMEAMAAGLPCIAADCPTGPADLIRDGVNGYLVKTGDVRMLAERISQVCAMDCEEREKTGRRARRSILEHYSCSRIAEQWEALFLSLC